MFIEICEDCGERQVDCGGVCQECIDRWTKERRAVEDHATKTLLEDMKKGLI